MSRVTDVILTTSSVETDEDDRPLAGVASVNAWLLLKHHCVLKGVTDHAGGNKVMQAGVFLVAVNHLDEPGLIAAVRDAPWERHEMVRLLLNREEDSGFELVVDGVLPRPRGECQHKEVTIWSFGDMSKAWSLAMDGYLAGIFEEPRRGVELQRGAFIAISAKYWGPAAEQLKDNIERMVHTGR